MCADSGTEPLLLVEKLSVRIGKPRETVVRDVSFNVGPGEIIGLAGESGSGKSVTALSLTRLLPPNAGPVCQGSVRLRGVNDNLLQAGQSVLRKVRGRRIGYIFQEPSASFNPVYTIHQHLEEILAVNSVPKSGRKDAIRRAMNEVGIPTDDTTLQAYPADFSGGMLQRTAIACALLGKPDLLVADEPTTALDTSTQKRVVDLLAGLNQSHGMAILFISHDLGLLKQLVSRVMVMRQGKIVESGAVADVLMNPQHSYTRDLVSALPKLRL